MIDTLLTMFWIFLPAGLANSGPVLANNVPYIQRFTYPLDAYKTFRGNRIFGSHKTVRGLVAGVIVGAVISALQAVLVKNTTAFDSYIYTLDYSSPMIMLYGAVIGFGALVGDAFKSFFKRQLAIAPGKSWVPFDQLDYVFGALIFSLFFFILPANYYVLGVTLGLIMHPLFNLLGWLLKLQDKPY